MRRIVIMGAGGRDFHNFNVVFRDDAAVEVVAFTAAQITGIDDRVYPPALAGARYPQGIPIRPEAELEAIVREEHVDEVVFAYSDVSHEYVMHCASAVLAAGADFRLLGPQSTMLQIAKPVVAVCATRTGAGKTPTSRRLMSLLRGAGLRAALVRHPMPYGDLSRMRVQRFASFEDIDAADPSLEEREEYESQVALGHVVYAGVDSAAVFDAAASEADAIVWDGGNNDFPFAVPDLLIVVADPLRAGDEVSYHPGETNLRLADVVVVNKIDRASTRDVATVLDHLHDVNPDAVVVRAASPISLGPGPELRGRRVLVIEDGPTVTHGGMLYGAATVAAQGALTAELVDPRPWAVGSIADAFERYPHLGHVLPALGYSPEQLDELARTVASVDCDVVVTGTPIDLGRLIDGPHPFRHATYDIEELGHPNLTEVLAPFIADVAARTPPRLG
jgi:predicted GTPase